MNPLRLTREPEMLWSALKSGRRIDCVVVGIGELGWEVRLLRDGSESYARRWNLRAEALAEAEELRHDYQRDQGKRSATSDW